MPARRRHFQQYFWSSYEAPTTRYPSPRFIIACYVVFSLCWIPATDWLLFHLIQDAGLVSGLQSAKGFVFIILTASILYVLMSRNIQHIAASEAGSREKHAQLLSLLDSIPDAIYVRDREGRYLLTNSIYARLVGQDKQALTGRKVDEPDESWGQDRQVIETGESISLERESVTDGQSVYFKVSKSPYRDENGEIQGVIGISRDISAEKEAEQALQAAHDGLENIVEMRTRELLRMNNSLNQEIKERTRAERELSETARLLENVFEVASDAMIVVSPARRTIMMCNPAVERILGYTPEEITGQGTRMLHVDDQAYERFAAIGEKELDRNGEFHTAWSLQHKDGRIIEVEIDQTALHPDNWREGIVSIIHDVTRQRLTLSVIEMVKTITMNISGAERLEDALTAVLTRICRSCGWHYGEVWLADPARNSLEPGPVYPVNEKPATARNAIWLDDYPGLIGEAWLSRVVVWTDSGSPEWARYFCGVPAEPRRACAIPVASQGGRGIVLQFVMDLHREEDELWVSAISAALTPVVILLDKIILEEEIRHAQQRLRNLAGRLHQASEDERAEIAREVHDDLGSSLTSIKFDLQWMERNAPAENDKLQERIKMMQQLADHMLTTVRNMSLRLHPPMLDNLGLQATLEWFLKDFRHRSGVICEADIDLEKLDNNHLRDTHIFRIIQESMTNVARHAMASTVSIRGRVIDNMIEMRLTDNGVGARTTELNSGRSLGVISMHERAQMLGGTLTITGVPDKGTTVNLKVPVNIRTLV